MMQKKLTNKQKVFHILCIPILYFIFGYLILTLTSYFFKGELLHLSEVIIETVAGAIGVSIVHWIHLVYPAKPPKDPNKPKKGLKVYIHQYIINGTGFHKSILIVYVISAISLITMISLTIIDRL